MTPSFPLPLPSSLVAEDLLPHTKPLLSWALRRTCNLHQAEDLVQDTLLHALSHLHEVRERERLGGWLFRIAERRFIDLIRRDRELEMPLQLEPSAPCPESEMRERGRYADLQRAVRRLPRALRIPVRLHYLQGRPLEEVAETLGTTITAVKSRLYRARHQLRERGLRERRIGERGSW